MFITFPQKINSPIQLKNYAFICYKLLNLVGTRYFIGLTSLNVNYLQNAQAMQKPKWKIGK